MQLPTPKTEESHIARGGPSRLRAQAAALARRPLATDLLATAGGRLGQLAFGLAGNVITARALGPVDFGRFGLVLATVTICGTLADAGLTYTAIKLIAASSGNEREPDGQARAHATALAYGVMRMTGGLLIGLLGVLFSLPICTFVLGYAALTPYMQLAFCTLFALGISSYPGTVLVALSRFRTLGVTGVLNAIITLAGIALLWAAGKLDLGTLIAWNVALPIISTLPAWLALPHEWRPWRLAREFGSLTPRREQALEIAGFSKWMGASLVASIIVAQGDLLLLGRLSTPAVVGVYSVALALASRLDILNQSLYTVMMPRASRLQGREAMRGYFGRVVRGSGLLAALLGAVALLSQPLILLLYGERYAASAGLFLALMLVVLFDLATSSLFLLAFPLNKPRVLAMADWLRVAVLVSVGVLLIPRLGGLGAAAARLLARVSGTLYTLSALRKAIGTGTEPPENGVESNVNTAAPGQVQAI